MTQPYIWSERALLLNTRSASSIGIIVIAAYALTLLDVPSQGGMFAAILVGSLVVYLAAVLCCCRLDISRTALRIGVFPYRKCFPLSRLKLADARQLSAEEHPRLRLRRNGIGLPGMQLGWFSTSAGKPVFAATAGRAGRVLIPTLDDYDLLVTSRQPERLLERLRAMPGLRTGIDDQQASPGHSAEPW